MPARRMSRLGSESAFEVLARAKAMEAQGKDVVHLEIGEPDFLTPRHIIDAAYEALKEGYTHYGPSPGLPEVRARIAKHISATRGIPVRPQQVVVTPGGKPIMFFTILALAQQGDEVIAPDPGFAIYHSMINFTGAKVVPMPLLEERGYRPNLEDLASKVNKRTRLVILNSPHNPCGSVLYGEELEAMASMLRDWPNLYILSDEVYCSILYRGRHQSIASLPGMAAKTIILDGFSKTYAMTGWRLGYGVFPEELAEPITKLVANSVSCAPPFIQRAALAALDGPQDEAHKMVAEFKRRRDAIVDGLRRIPGMTCTLPDGAFYVFPGIKGTGLTSRQYETLALQEAGVALIAGSSFGRYGEGYVRLSYANSLENINKALERLDAMVRRHRR